MKIQGLKQISFASFVTAITCFNLSHADDAFSPQSKYFLVTGMENGQSSPVRA
jgi:porin